MFFLYILLLIGTVAGSHYRGGTVSYTIRAISDNITTNSQGIPVRITQRHSWRRSAFFCNNTDPDSGNIIGEGVLKINQSNSNQSWMIPDVDTSVRCTDYNEEFDYSSGENSTTVLLPLNERIEYLYQGCCWIPLLPPDSESNWSLKFVINTNRRLGGTLNNSPKTTMNPIVQVELGKIHVIRIPMADSDGDLIQCRWGKSLEECGTICTPKGPLRSNPCELTYNASRIGYHAVALVIEDFDSNSNVLSAIPLQFLIHIVNTTTITTEPNCTEPPVYIGEWPQDSCIGVESNTTINARIQMRIPCENTSVTLQNILTISPAGLIKGEIIRDSSDQNMYTMPIEWTPRFDQYGIQQLCLTPVDSQQRQGSQVCLTFQVDVGPPEFILLTPTGLVSTTQSSWTIETDRNIVKPRQSSGVHIRFFKRSSNEEIYRIDVATDVNVIYQPRQITFFTTGITWEQGEEYYILLDSGIAIINESCGVQSVSITNPYTWIFRVAVAETTFMKPIMTTKQLAAQITTEQVRSRTPTTEQVRSTKPTTEQIRSTTQTTEQVRSTKPTTEHVRSTTQTTEQVRNTQQTTPSTRPACPRWFQFNTISNESTSANEPYFIFCFRVETTLADVTISANTWVPCMKWKLSGTADPLLELYSESDDKFLAQNDDGSSLANQNCYAAVLSYRLQQGNYRVIIRNPKCAYGRFEVRLSAEIEQNLK